MGRRQEDLSLLLLFNLVLDDMVLSVGNPKRSTKKLLELTNEFSMFVRYNMDIQKSTVFLYTKKKYVETKLKNTVTFIIMSKKIKYPRPHCTS